MSLLRSRGTKHATLQDRPPPVSIVHRLATAHDTRPPVELHRVSSGQRGLASPAVNSPGKNQTIVLRIYCSAPGSIRTGNVHLSLSLVHACGSSSVNCLVRIKWVTKRNFGLTSIIDETILESLTKIVEFVKPSARARVNELANPIRQDVDGSRAVNRPAGRAAVACGCLDGGVFEWLDGTVNDSIPAQGIYCETIELLETIAKNHRTSPSPSSRWAWTSSNCPP